jgi:hypothetical protein
VSLRIIVTGLIAQHPDLGGMTWHYIQYVAGLARLGHDVYYIEDSGEFPYDPQVKESLPEGVVGDCQYHVRQLAKAMDRFGLGERWAYCHPPTLRWYGLSDRDRREVVRTTDLLLNVSGTLVHPEQYVGPRRRVYIDTDPVVTQAKLAAGRRGFSARVAAHDVHFSFGEHFSEAVPSTDYRWRPTRQPMLLSEWRSSAPSRQVFSTVMSWTSYEPLVHEGRSLGQKDVEFEHFLDLPRHVAPARLEVALARTRHKKWESGPSDGWEGESPHERLVRAGWQVADAGLVGSDLDRYREYIQASQAEWSVAKNAYVQGRPGWFSERSACYLASGRPVVVQDTGLAPVLPTGTGILTFSTLSQAAEAIREVRLDYDRHARAAREIAEACFDSDRVLTRLIEEAS